MEIKNLTYENKLKNINYTFDSKKIYGFIGKEENIKSLLEIISDLVKPDQGEIIGNGKTFMLFSDTDSQIFNETVKSEILYGLDEDKVDLKGIFNKLSLDDDLYDKNPLSLGESEKKKVVFASMLAFDPDVIVIDNFFNKIDFKTKKIFVELLKRLQFDEHKIIIISDRNIDLLYELVDEIIVLSDEIVLSGKKFDVFEQRELLADLEIEMPSYVEFANYVSINKNIDLFYRDRVTDIVKDVYDNVQ